MRVVCQRKSNVVSQRNFSDRHHTYWVKKKTSRKKEINKYWNEKTGYLWMPILKCLLELVVISFKNVAPAEHFSSSCWAQWRSFALSPLWSNIVHNSNYSLHRMCRVSAGGRELASVVPTLKYNTINSHDNQRNVWTHICICIFPRQ